MSIPDRLKAAIAATTGDMTAFAERAGVPYRTLQNYVGGTRAPKAETLSQICTRMGIDAHWLLTGEGSMRRAEFIDELGRGGADDRPGDRVAETGQDQGSHGPRIDALVGLLDQLSAEDRDAIIADALSRAKTAKRLDECGQALNALRADQSPKKGVA